MMKCAFEPCLCQIPKGEKYCSDFCEAFGAGTVAITSVEGEVPRLSGRESSAPAAIDIASARRTQTRASRWEVVAEATGGALRAAGTALREDTVSGHVFVTCGDLRHLSCGAWRAIVNSCVREAS